MSYTAKSEDDDVAQIFLEKLEIDLRCIWSKKKFKDPTNMIFTEEDKRNYDKATKCHICCKDGFVEGDEKKNKVRDHCKQPLWLGYVETITFTWIQVDE